MSLKSSLCSVRMVSRVAFDEGGHGITSGLQIISKSSPVVSDNFDLIEEHAVNEDGGCGGLNFYVHPFA